MLKKCGQVLWAKESFSAGGKTYPAGTLIIRSHSVSRSFMDSLAKELHMDIDATGKQVPVKTYRLNSPRVALYKSWIGRGSEDEGWTRWLFEKYEFPYKNIKDADVRAGNLGKRFDVLVIPSIGKEAIINGNKEGTIPPQYVGGITEAGVKNIREFVESGGTLVTLRQGCDFVIDSFSIPVCDALKGLKTLSHVYGEVQEAGPAKFACPGSMLAMEFNKNHPVAYGMPDKAPGMFYQGTAFDISSSFKEKDPVAIARYPESKLLLSGFLRGEKYLQNKAAAVDVPLNKGRVILLGFAVQNRAQPHGTFKLLFNSLYYGAVK